MCAVNARWCPILITMAGLALIVFLKLISLCHRCRITSLYDNDSVARYWLKQGADGWRLDVMGDASFPPEFWRVFRDIVKSTDPEAIIIGELWQKDSTLLRNLRGETADTTINYRLRDAVLGLLTQATST